MKIMCNFDSVPWLNVLAASASTFFTYTSHCTYVYISRNLEVNKKEMRYFGAGVYVSVSSEVGSLCCIFTENFFIGSGFFDVSFFRVSNLSTFFSINYDVIFRDSFIAITSFPLNVFPKQKFLIGKLKGSWAN